MKRQLFISEIEKAHNDGSLEHLICTHAASPCAAFEKSSLVKVLQNVFTNGRSIIDDGANSLQYLFLWVAGCRFHQRHLFLLLFALSVCGFFLAFVINIGI